GSNVAFSAGIGFDRVTGLGSPKWSALAASLGQFSVDAPIATRSTSVPATWSTPLGGLPYRGWSAPVVDGSSDCSTTSATTKATVSLPAVEGWHTITVAGLDGSAANGGAGACRIATARVLLDRAKPSATASLRVGGA